MLKSPFLLAVTQLPHRTLLRHLYNVRFFLAVGVFLLAHGLTTGYVAAQLQNGLIGYWSFDDGTGTTAADSSGNGNTGTLVNGPSWVSSGEIAGALFFDGDDDYVSFASQPQGTISISAWVYAQATPGNVFPRIIDMPGYVLFLAEPSNPNSNPASLGFLSRRSDRDGEWDTPVNSMAYNSWNHVAVVYDSSSTSNNADLYINGVKQTISKITSPQGTQTANEGVGIIGNRIPLNRGWEGLIDELRVYNRALSAAEIVSLYDQGNSGPFNFSLSNSMSLSANQGSSATNTLTASLVSGSPQSVSFSASGLPSAASASFSQKTCSPTCSSLLTIATAASTPAGSYTISVTGAGGGVTRTTNFALAVNAASTSPPPSGNISASPSSITFQTTVGGSLPPTQSIMVTVPGGGRWSTNDTSLFYDAEPCFSGAGASCASGTATTLTPIPSFFQTAAAGTYFAPLTISSSGYPDLVIPVTLTVNASSTSTVATPTITPNGGSFMAPVSVTLQTVSSGASIFYTTDGSAPTQSSTLYTGAFTLTSSAMVNAIAFKSGSNPSAQASADFTVLAPVAAPAQLTLTWQDNSNDEDNFAIERKTGMNGAYSQLASVAANVTSYLDTDVTSGVTYCYRVQAVNNAGASAYTNEACKTVS